MRLVAACAALLACAPALAQPAPPTAADSALVEDVVAALQVGALSDELMGPTWRNSPPWDGGDPAAAVADSLHVLLLADLRPDLLREARSFLSEPSYAEFVAHSVREAENLSTLDAIRDRVLEPDTSALADETLSRRLVQARARARAQAALTERVREGGVDHPALDRVSQLTAGSDQTRVIFMRAVLHGLPRDMLAGTVAFYESPAGQYVHGAVTEATMQVAVPGMIRFFNEVQEAGGRPPWPGSFPPDTARVYEVAEVQPELIGGLDSLMARVVYPEEARRAEIEGQVVIQFVVNEGGAVEAPTVLRSPDPLLSEAAIAAVRASRFTPGTVDGELVRVRFALPVTFRLEAPAPPDTTVTIARTAEPVRLIRALQGVQEQLVYPEDARAEGVEGTVDLLLTVGPGGEVTRAEVVGSPDPRLAEAAVRTVRVADLPGAGVPVSLPYTFRFSLDGRPAPLGGGPDADGVYLVTDTPPELIGGLRGLQERLDYPEEARRLGVQGQVVVQFVVTESGAVRDAEIVSTPNPMLSDAALRAVRASRFEPATVDGEPARVRFAVPLNFRLR